MFVVCCVLSLICRMIVAGLCCLLGVAVMFVVGLFVQCLLLVALCLLFVALFYLTVVRCVLCVVCCVFCAISSLCGL